MKKEGSPSKKSGLEKQLTRAPETKKSAAFLDRLRDDMRGRKQRLKVRHHTLYGRVLQ